MDDVFDPKSRRRQSETDGMPWQIKAVGLIGVPSAIACYLIWALVSGVVPAMLSMQQTMGTLVGTISSITTEHAAQKVQNERIIQILQATCVNAAQTTIDRERCIR